jgi:hypothetical protein
MTSRLNYTAMAPNYKILFFALLAVVIAVAYLLHSGPPDCGEGSFNEKTGECIYPEEPVNGKEPGKEPVEEPGKPDENGKLPDKGPEDDPGKPGQEGVDGPDKQPLPEIQEIDINELALESGLHLIFTKDSSYSVSTNSPIRNELSEPSGDPESWAPLVWLTESPSIISQDGDLVTVSLSFRNFGFVSAENVRLILDDSTEGISPEGYGFATPHLLSSQLAPGEMISKSITVDLEASSEREVLMYHLTADYGNRTYTFGNGRRPVVFVSSRDETSWKVYLINPDGTGLFTITPDDDWHDFPAWTYDESGVEYNNMNHEIFLAKPDGSSRERIILPDGHSPRNVVFSPTMNKIAASTGMYTYDDQESIQYIASLGSNPAFSPDGASVAYWEDGKLFLVDSDGQNRREVFSGETGSGGGMLSWSPDGQYLLAGLAVVKSDSSGVDYLSSGRGNNCWSPGGATIAHIVANPRNEIYVTRRDSSATAQLTQTPPSSIGIDCGLPDKQLGRCARECCSDGRDICRDCAHYHNEWGHGDWVPVWYGR